MIKDKKNRKMFKLFDFFASTFYSYSLIYLDCDLKFQLKWYVTDS